ncbi:MAG: plasmid stabilization protein [Planctomycetota bacterium]|nr:MAG: plasmid stabilization protein [Planctomycetota bacterium]
MKLEVDSHAEAELHEAAVWYSRQRSGLGNEFLAEVKDAFSRIREAPARSSQLETLPNGSRVRRMLLKRFPYSIIYEVKSDTVYVLAVAHVRRRPNYWSRRRRRN